MALGGKLINLSFAVFTPIPTAKRLSPDGRSRWRSAFPPSTGKGKDVRQTSDAGLTLQTGLRALSSKGPGWSAYSVNLYLPDVLTEVTR